MTFFLIKCSTHLFFNSLNCRKDEPSNLLYIVSFCHILNLLYLFHLLPIILPIFQRCLMKLYWISNFDNPEKISRVLMPQVEPIISWLFVSKYFIQLHLEKHSHVRIPALFLNFSVEWALPRPTRPILIGSQLWPRGIGEY